jgi:hypothetical protein
MTTTDSLTVAEGVLAFWLLVLTGALWTHARPRPRGRHVGDEDDDWPEQLRD